MFHSIFTSLRGKRVWCLTPFVFVVLTGMAILLLPSSASAQGAAPRVPPPASGIPKPLPADHLYNVLNRVTSSRAAADASEFTGTVKIGEAVLDAARSALLIATLRIVASQNTGGLITIAPDSTAGWGGYINLQRKSDNLFWHISGPRGGGDNGDLTFYYNDGSYHPVLTLQNDGNVGIGTTNPRGTLDVNGRNAYIGSIAVAMGYAGSGYPGIGYNFEAQADGTWKYKATDTAYMIGLGQGHRLDFNYAPSGNAGETIRWTTGMTMRNDGNVGIGTTAPGYALEVKRTTGNAEIISNYNDTNIGRLTAASNGNVYMGVVGGTGSLAVGTTKYPTALNIAGSSGSVGIGATDPKSPFHVSSSSGDMMRVENVGGSEADIRFLASTGGWQVGTNNAGNGTSGNQFYIYNDKDNSYPLTVQRGTGNVGIGTTSPIGTLDVNGNIVSARISDTTNAGYYDWYNLSNNRRWHFTMRSGDDDKLQLYFNRGTANGSNYQWDGPFLNVNPNGNVGIGTTNPQQKLHVAGNAAVLSGGWNAGDITGTLNIGGNYNGTTLYYSNAIKSINTASSPYILKARLGFFTLGGKGETVADEVERLSILADNGNVGIGTTGPERKLDISFSNDNSRQSDPREIDGIRVINTNNTVGTYSALTFGSNGTASGIGSRRVSDDAQDIFFFSEGGAFEKMTIKPSGKVGIGTNDPQAKLDIAGSFRQAGFTRHPVGNLEAASAPASASNYDYNRDYRGVDEKGVQIKSEEEMLKVRGRAFEIARIGYDPNNWSSNTTVFIELYNKYYTSGGYKRYAVSAGYLDNGTIRLLEATGQYSNSNNRDVRVRFEGDSVQINGGKSYRRVFVDVDNYSSWDVVVSHGMQETPSTTPGVAQIWIAENPQGAQIASFDETDVVTRDGDMDVMGTTSLRGNTFIGGSEGSNNIGGYWWNQPLAFYTADDKGKYTENMRITASGNVGIGIDPSWAKLAVNGYVYIGGNNSKLFVHGNGYDGTIAVAPSVDDNEASISFRQKANFGGINWVLGQNAWGVGTGNFAIGGNGSNKLTILSNGDVGIGTNPGAKLDVEGKVYLRGDTYIGSNSKTSNNIAGYWWGLPLAFWTISSSADGKSAVFNERMRIANNGNVGIGTTDPKSRLSIKGDGTGIAQIGSACGGNYAGITLWKTTAPSGCNEYNFLSSPTDSNLYINRTTGKDILFREANGSAQLIIKSGGNVGIGTDDPKTRLHVVATGGFPSGVPIVAQSNSTFFGARDANGNERFAINLDSDNTSYPVNFYDKYNNSWNHSLTLKKGNVGIGTTDPKTRLHVAEGITIGTGSGGDGDNLRLLSNVNHWNLDNYSGRLRFFSETGYGTGGIEHMTIKANGYVGIGIGDPQHKLHVIGSINVAFDDKMEHFAEIDNKKLAHNPSIRGFDIAESFVTDREVSTGDIVVTSGKDNILTKSSVPYQDGIIGVVSTAPAILFEGNQMKFAANLNFKKGKKPPIALVGRVPVKVTQEGGSIKPGDYLTTSSKPGYAMKANKPGPTVGIALESFDSSDEGMILVFIDIGEKNFNLLTSEVEKLKSSNAMLEDSNNIIQKSNADLKKRLEFLEGKFKLLGNDNANLQQ